MKATLITKNRELREIARNHTTATLTFRLPDGSFAFSDGRGRYYRRALVMIPGYDYVYGEATASADHDSAWDALGDGYPMGSQIYFADRVDR